jgi:hypothetical protein
LASALACRDPDPARHSRPTSAGTASGSPAPSATSRRAPAPALPAYEEHDDLATAVTSVLPLSTRLVGIGELHARTDLPSAPSTLARFTEAVLPALADRTSDLVLETWTTDPSCGKVSAQATESLRAATRRPAATQDDLGSLVQNAKQRGVRAHAMRVTCDDYRAMADGGDQAIVHMMDLTTAELTRLSTALLTRSPNEARPLVIVYGGALHNDRFPDTGVETWSYAAAVEQPSRQTYVELDLIVPELAEVDPATARKPWAPLLGVSRRVVTYRRGERSYVIILPRAAKAK